MVTGDVKLIGSWASVFVMRARIALNLKSISYEFLQETYGTKSELLVKSNPVHKKMPVLLHADKPPYDRAIARFWAAYVDDKWFIALRSILTAQGEEEKKTAIAEVEERTDHLEKAFIDCSNGKPFFNGTILVT
ncbi:hypothetical protein YC2023_104282 [Brassica napus]